MQPETAREAWERGVEDAERFSGHANPISWVALTGSDPREPGYEKIFDGFARDWRAGFEYGMAEREGDRGVRRHGTAGDR